MNDVAKDRFPLPFPVCGRTVLVSPLHWGLGHASRCIEITNWLLQQGASVVLAGGGSSGQLLRQTFPQLPFEYLPAFELHYSQKGMGIFTILKQAPKFYRQTQKEQQLLQSIIDTHSIQLIISDNRYGLYHHQIPSIIICHQVHPPLPKSLTFLQPLVNKFHRTLLFRFSECWIPDYALPNNNLSGKLSHAQRIRAPKFRYIEPLSQFSSAPITQSRKSEFDILLLLSGPEPQRTIFETLLLEALIDCSLRIALVRGTTQSLALQSNVQYSVDFAQGELLKEVIHRSRLIICRSGYSSIMDLIRLQKRAILIPTPKQTEQEYLARHIASNEHIAVISQDEIKKSLQFLITSMLEASDS